MNTHNDVVSLLKLYENRHGKDNEPNWEPDLPGYSEAEILALEEEYGEKFPDDYRQFLLYAKYGWLYSGNTEVCIGGDVDHWNTHLPGMLLLGNGCGGNMFFLDPQNLIGKGAWAVYLTGMGSAGFDYSSYVASNFTHFVERIINGDSLDDEPWLKVIGLPAEASDHVRLKFSAEDWLRLEETPFEAQSTPPLLLHPCDGELWSPKAPVSVATIQAAEQQLHTQLPEDFRQFLLFSNGGRLGELLLFTLDRCVAMSFGSTHLPVLPGAIFLAASDNYFYYFHAKDYESYSAWSIFFVGKNQQTETHPRCAARNFTHLLLRVLRQENLAFPSLEEIDEAKQRFGANFPQGYWDAYVVRLNEYRFFATINFFDAHKLFYYNFHAGLSSNLPEMVVFGTYANCLLFFDPRNHLKQGSWAVYSTDRSKPSSTNATYLATNFDEFLLYALNVLEPYTAELEASYAEIAVRRSLLGWGQPKPSARGFNQADMVGLLRQFNSESESSTQLRTLLILLTQDH